MVEIVSPYLLLITGIYTKNTVELDKFAVPVPGNVPKALGDWLKILGSNMILCAWETSGL